MNRLKFVAAAVLVTTALVGSALVAPRAGRIEPPTPQPAATVVEEPKPDAAPAPAPALGKHTLNVRALDLTSFAPLPGARITLRTDRSDERPSAVTDAFGSVRFPVADDCRFLVLRAELEGRVPLYIQWSRGRRTINPPDRLVFRMEKATTIRGRVVDQDNKPLAGAKVVIDVKCLYPGGLQQADLSFRTTVADADGRWSFSCIPENPFSIKVTAYHEQCLTESTCFLPEEYKPASELRDGSATLKLRRGTIVAGTVVGPDGRPVPDAEILIGNDRRYGNSIPPIKTDTRGRFTLGFKPGIATTLIARHPGFGPAMEPLRIGGERQHVTIRLPSAHRMTVRVVGREGKPVPHAEVTVRSWRGTEAIVEDFRTDADGRFTWNDAPGEEVRISVGAEGYRGESDITVQPEQSIEVALKPLDPTPRIVGTVIDARTGQPIPMFSLKLGSVPKGRHRRVWERVDDFDRDPTGDPGRFAFELHREPHDAEILRAEAWGYVPADSPLVDLRRKTHSHEFRLVPSDPIRGTLLNPDGSPGNGWVYRVLGEGQFRLDNGYVAGSQVESGTRTDGDGHFALAPQKDDYVLVVLGNVGYAVVSSRDFRDGGSIRLQPWARIEGTYRIDGEPVAGVELHSFDDEYPPYDGQLHVQNYVLVKTDAAGHFVMPRVFPGRRVIRLRVPNNLERRYWPVDLATVDAQGGRTVQLKIGETGRTVAGRFQIPTSSAWMVRKASIEPVSSGNPKHPSIGINITNDGRFRALDLPPGDYVMKVALHEPPPDNSCGWGRLVVAYRHEIHISGGANDGPLDLGDVQPAETGGKPLAPGDPAPDFAVKTLDGQELKLSRFRGRYVLLDFWATWCAPCIAEMPNIDAIHKAHGADRRFAVVSLSLDDKPADASTFIKAQQYGWTQGHVGPDSPVVAAYGATAIPATFLIGPDGRILAAGLRGEKLKSAVAGVLDPPAPR